MNSGNSRPDAELSCRPAQDDAIESGAADDHGSGTPAQPAGAQRPLQDIQDIIDKLAAVTQQLRRPTSSLHGSPRLAGCDRGLIRADPVPRLPGVPGQGPQQAGALSRAEGRRAEQSEGPDVAGDLFLALQVDASG